MLRGLVALLIVANIGFFAWSQGWLDPLLGGGGLGEREPERLKRQVHPEAAQLLSPAAAAAAAAAASALAAASPACLEAGPYTDKDLPAAERVLRDAGVAEGRWTPVAVEQPGVWLAYMGRFADRDTLQKKEAELQRLHVAYDEVRDNAELAPGLALGRFEDKAGADAALAQLTQRGVRTARVVALVAAGTRTLLRVSQPDAALADKLQALKAPGGSLAFRSCE